MEVGLLERLSRSGLSGGRLSHRSALVAKDSRVDTASETSGTEVGVRTNPVVTDGLVCVQLKAINSERRPRPKFQSDLQQLNNVGQRRFGLSRH